MVGRVWPRRGHRGRPLNSGVRHHMLSTRAFEIAKLGVLILSMLCSSCQVQSAVLMDLGHFSDVDAMRAVHERAVAVLGDMGFEIHSLSSDDRFEITWFVDPQSPAEHEGQWYAQVLSEISKQSVTVAVIQPGANTPSKNLKSRSLDVLARLKSSLPDLNVQIKE